MTAEETIAISNQTNGKAIIVNRLGYMKVQ
jgi:hypothetical protein